MRDYSTHPHLRSVLKSLLLGLSYKKLVLERDRNPNPVAKAGPNNSEVLNSDTVWGLPYKFGLNVHR